MRRRGHFIASLGALAGSTEIERGELEGDCTGWPAIPEHWVREGKITVHLRFSRTLLPGNAESAAVARDLLADPKKQQILDLLTASSLVGRPYIAPKATPPEQVAALRAAVDATMRDPEFLAECAKQFLTVASMTGAEVERFITNLHRTPPDVVAAARTISGD